MTGFRSLMRRAAVLALASLAASLPVAAQAAGVRPGPPVRSVRPVHPARAAAGWQVRTVLREGERARGANQVLSPRLGADFSLLPLNQSDNLFRLRRSRLGGGATTAGPEFHVSGLRLASGFLWVGGPVYSGRHSLRVRMVLHQVSVVTLRVIRSWTLLPTQRLTGFANDVSVAPGPGRTVWVGFRRTLRLIRPASGATVMQVKIPAGNEVVDVATDPQRHHLYAAAATRPGGGAVFEYLAGAGAPVASATGEPLAFALGGASLTAVPGAVWASFRTGMLGETVLLRQRDLAAVPLHRPIFAWAMWATTVAGGGALWLATEDGVMGCIGPQSGAVRARAMLATLRGSGQLLAADPARHLVYGVGRAGLVAITPPLACWR